MLAPCLTAGSRTPAFRCEHKQSGIECTVACLRRFLCANVQRHKSVYIDVHTYVDIHVHIHSFAHVYLSVYTRLKIPLFHIYR